MLHVMYLAKSKGVNSLKKKKKTPEFNFIPDYHALRAKKKIFPGDGSGCICIIWIKGKLHMIWTPYLTVLSLTSKWCLYSCWGYILASKCAGFLSFVTWFFAGNHLWGLQGCSGQDKIMPSPHRCPCFWAVQPGQRRWALCPGKCHGSAWEETSPHPAWRPRGT